MGTQITLSAEDREWIINEIMDMTADEDDTVEYRRTLEAMNSKELVFEALSHFIDL